MVLEKIYAKADAQADGAVVGMVLERLVIVDLRFDGHRTADEEGIAHLDAGQDIIVAATAMPVRGGDTEEESVLLHIVAASQTPRQCERNIFHLLVSQMTQQHHVVVKQVTDLALYADAAVLQAVVAEVKTGKRSANV